MGEKKAAISYLDVVDSSRLGILSFQWLLSTHFYSTVKVVKISVTLVYSESICNDYKDTIYSVPLYLISPVPVTYVECIFMVVTMEKHLNSKTHITRVTHIFFPLFLFIVLDYIWGQMI